MDNASVKSVTIANHRFRLHGDPADRYFRDYVHDGQAFKDAPIAVAMHYLEPKSVVVDVGANIGLSILALARLASPGRVVSIEPSPANFELLVRNIDDNGLTNVTPLRAAASDKPVTLQLQEDPAFMAGSRIPVTVSQDATARYASVRALTLDAEFCDLARLDFVKIDVEGHERQVLGGARKTLDRFRPLCVIEFNSYSMVYNEGTDPKDFLSFLQGVFPYVFHFDKSGYARKDVRGREEAFHAINEKTGFVDDLVCAFAPLPRLRLHRTDRSGGGSVDDADETRGSGAAISYGVGGTVPNGVPSSAN